MANDIMLHRTFSLFLGLRIEVVINCAIVSVERKGNFWHCGDTASCVQFGKC